MEVTQEGSLVSFVGTLKKATSAVLKTISPKQSRQQTSHRNRHYSPLYCETRFARTLQPAEEVQAWLLKYAKLQLLETTEEVEIVSCLSVCCTTAAGRKQRASKS
jgi:hypothetical protein